MNRTKAIVAVIGIGLLVIFLQQANLYGEGIDPSTSGSMYVIAFPDTTTNTYDTRFLKRQNDTVALFIYSDVDNTVVVTSPNGYHNIVTPRAGKFEILYLNAYEKPAKPAVASVFGTEAWTTFRVESRRPIMLYCYISTKFGTEAFTPLPVESWGQEYFVASHPGEVISNVEPNGETTYGMKNSMAPAELLITAAYDKTTVQIFPAKSTVFPENPRLTVTLKANQYYLLQTLVDTLASHQGNMQPDLAGTRIVANKPIAVISGNTRAQLNPNERGGLARNAFKNLCIEALAPLEQHGREFVYLPTWDARRITGAADERTQDKRSSEFVRIYGEDSATTTVVHDSGSSTVDIANVYQDRRWVPRARAYRTSHPSQAFMASAATIIDNGSTGSIGFLGGSYYAYGTYMVELVPREQWTSFAPYYAPTNPPGMEHFVNIVADTASARRIFDEDGRQVQFNNGTVPGTDLVWGSMAVAPGLTHYFVGRDGARFYAFAYGLLRGYELYRPGRTEEKDSEQGLAGGGNKGNELLHPSEYEEEVAQSYGYPLAPRRVVLSAPDSLVIETIAGCESVHVKVQTANATPLGLRTIYLDSSSTESDIRGVPPNWQMQLIGASQTDFDVVLREGASRDSGRVIIQDRSGKIYPIRFNLTSSHIQFIEGTKIQLAETRATQIRDTVVSVINATNTPLVVEAISLSGTQSGFTIIGISPQLPATLLPTSTLQVDLRFSPLAANKTFYDTLSATLDCGDARLELVAKSISLNQAPDVSRAGYAIGSVRPTPTDGRSNVSFRLGRPGDLALHLYDQRGELVLELHRTGLNSGEGSVALDASSLPAGTYLLRLSSGEWSATTVVVVVR
jgi:hypothetical protein